MTSNFVPLLTTEDNPYNPFTEWDAWYNFDITKGYDTCGLLARVVNADDDLDDNAALDAMRQIVHYNFSGKHVIVTNAEFEQLVPTFNT